jgi:hypothetical protein
MMYIDSGWLLYVYEVGIEIEIPGIQFHIREQWWLIGSNTRLQNCSPGFKSSNLPSLQWTAVLRWAAIWDGTSL